MALTCIVIAMGQCGCGNGSGGKDGVLERHRYYTDDQVGRLLREGMSREEVMNVFKHWWVSSSDQRDGVETLEMVAYPVRGPKPVDWAVSGMTLEFHDGILGHWQVSGHVQVIPGKRPNPQ